MITSAESSDGGVVLHVTGAFDPEAGRKLGDVLSVPRRDSHVVIDFSRAATFPDFAMGMLAQNIQNAIGSVSLVGVGASAADPELLQCRSPFGRKPHSSPMSLPQSSSVFPCFLYRCFVTSVAIAPPTNSSTSIWSMFSPNPSAHTQHATAPKPDVQWSSG